MPNPSMEVAVAAAKVPAEALISSGSKRGKHVRWPTGTATKVGGSDVAFQRSAKDSRRSANTARGSAVTMPASRVATAGHHRTAG